MFDMVFFYLSRERVFRYHYCDTTNLMYTEHIYIYSKTEFLPVVGDEDMSLQPVIWATDIETKQDVQFRMWEDGLLRRWCTSIPRGFERWKDLAEEQRLTQYNAFKEGESYVDIPILAHPDKAKHSNTRQHVQTTASMASVTPIDF